MKKSFYHIALMQLIMSYLLPMVALAEVTSFSRPIELNSQTPSSYLIEDIQVTGTQALDKEAIIALAGIKVNDIVELPGTAISKVIHSLWKQDLIKDVNVYASQVKDHCIVLTIDVTESPRLSDYFFEGIKSREQEKLSENIALVKEKIVTDEFIKNTKQSIEDYWTEKGYLYTTVTVTSLPDPDHIGHVYLHIKINKNKKFRINAVDFEGNQHISSDLLRGQLKRIREKPRFTLVKDIFKQILTLQPIKKGGALRRQLSLEEMSDYYQKHVIFSSSMFNTAKFQEEKKRIVDYYQSQGYRDAAIVEESVYTQEDGLLNIKIRIEEGKQYQVGTIRWVGNHRYDDDTLNQVLGIKEGDIYNLSLLQQKFYPNPQEQNVASLYKNNGHLFFWAEPVEVGLEGNKVALELRMQEGPEAHINQILIEGNRLTHDDVIRRELRTLPGDKFNMANLLRSYRELAMLNIFDPATIGIAPIPNADGTVNIKYTVKERPKFEIKVSGSYAGEEGIIGGAVLATNNFSLGNLFKGRLPVGGGQTLGLKAETNGKQYKNFGIQFVEPWLGGVKPRQFSLSLNKSFEGNTGSTGGSIGLGTRLSWPDDYTMIRSSIAYYRHYYKDYDLLDTGRNNAKSSGILNDLSATISIERNSIDNPIYPKKGSKLELTANLTPPLSWFSSSLAKQEKYRWKEYHQWMLDGSYFLHIAHGLVMNTRGQFGVLGNFSSQQEIGPFERFYLGGGGPGGRALRGKESISLRGYQDEYFTPVSKDTHYKGGVIYNKLSLELRYPVISSHLASIYTLAFAEAGNTWGNYKNYNLSDIKRSAGLGLRLYLPFIVGTTLGFDWGYGFDKNYGDKSKGGLEFHFSFGAGSGK